MMAATDPFVDEVVRQRILAELDAIERDHGVRILFAVESGSRAWGFPSRDSDYDVRFVYVRPIEHYLALKLPRDVIELPIDDTLDIGGWDLRKALTLSIDSSAALLEWLESPIRYRGLDKDARRLRELARSTADQAALASHYFRLASRSFTEISEAESAARLKTYCYALRSVLALLWLRWRQELPPMDLPSLLAGLTLSATVRSSVDALIARKTESTERDTTPHLPPIDQLIEKALTKPAPQPAPSDRLEPRRKADALFASIVLDSHSAASAGS